MKLIFTLFLFGLFGIGTAPAMQIYAFAKLKTPDQATYVDNMVEASSKMLKEQGHPDQAQQILDLFRNTTKEGGVNQFVMKMKDCDVLNRRNATNPNNRHPVLQVEDAMSLMLKEHGIIVPVKFLLSVNEHFMPTIPNIKQLMQQ